MPEYIGKKLDRIAVALEELVTQSSKPPEDADAVSKDQSLITGFSMVVGTLNSLSKKIAEALDESDLFKKSQKLRDFQKTIDSLKQEYERQINEIKERQT